MKLERETKETVVRVDLTRGEGAVIVDAGDPFLTHMMQTLARYAGLTLTLEARGDLRHHLIEDVAITLGRAVRGIVPATCVRYAHRVLPMDDVLVEVALDLGGRPYYRGPLPVKLYDHWMRSFTDAAMATLHTRVRRGRDPHHIVEAAIKALGLALRDAMTDSGAVFSTKGSVTWRRDGEDVSF